MALPIPPSNEETPLFPPSDPHPQLETWAGFMHRMTLDCMRTGFEVASDRACDVVRQLCGIVFFGTLCYPCSVARLVGYYTGCCDPMKAGIPGPELCSSNNGCEICQDRGYEHREYTASQRDGSGCSPRTLDMINVLFTTALYATAVPLYPGHIIAR